ncbi:hypothetical protein QYE76_025397 [Lolium multiflorum]|uniref:HMA domain-containing protein n=1 Tax=Lolium multiflorum TaxID=4521 RepID=A0AAD8VWN2_LOLMU|nr:hypothetical protein QYE76_025397 [Lolium multiflorum]
MGGTLKQLVLGLLGAASGGHGGKKKKEERRQQQTVELMVRMDCERCERQVRKALAGIRGVEHVEVNRRQQRVTVTGSVDPHKVLLRARSTGKKAELWPQKNPCYNGAAVMAHHGAIGAVQAHERWAPPVYPRHPDAMGAGAEHITDLFSDENPNACTVM